MGGWADGSVDQGAEGSEDSRWLVKPLHPQVRIVTDGERAGYYVEVCDGRAWRCETEALFRGVAELRARWLSDVLEHARDSALEEAALFVDVDDQQAADAIRRLKGPKT